MNRPAADVVSDCVAAQVHDVQSDSGLFPRLDGGETIARITEHAVQLEHDDRVGLALTDHRQEPLTAFP